MFRGKTHGGTRSCGQGKRTTLENLQCVPPRRTPAAMARSLPYPSFNFDPKNLVRAWSIPSDKLRSFVASRQHSRMHPCPLRPSLARALVSWALLEKTDLAIKKDEHRLSCIIYDMLCTYTC